MINENFQYYFVLGTNHSLSKVDIINVLSKRDVDFSIKEASEEILVIETKKNLDFDSLMLKLGSAVKIGQIFEKYPQKNFPQNFLKEISKKKFKNFFLTQKDSDFRFGISVYSGGGFKNLNKTLSVSKMIGRVIKKKLKIRFVNLKERKIPSFMVDKTGFLSSGFELVIISGSGGTYIGKTLSVQDYKNYSLRDYGRPERDARSGMISPKLAKIIINLAGKDKGKTFLDPFCGSGTFLQELVLLGYKNIIGSDIEQKSIDSTKQNLNWLFENFSTIDKRNHKINIFKSNVLDLSIKLPANSIDVIVTEPFLGSSQSSHFSLSEIKGEIEKLSKLYIEAFTQFAKILKECGVVVIIFPIFKKAGSFYHLEILEKIFSLGFCQKTFLTEKPKGENLLRLKVTKRGSIVFFHPGQIISREIFIFGKE